MKFVKEERPIRSIKEFDIPEELYNGLRLAEQPLSYPDLKNKIHYMAYRQLDRE
jgi:hypothetical protein